MCVSCVFTIERGKEQNECVVTVDIYLCMYAHMYITPERNKEKFNTLQYNLSKVEP